MRKKIFISFLLVAIFNLLVGCYTTNYVALNELKDFKDNNDVVITTTDSKEYILKRDSTHQYYSNWVFVDDSIEWTESKVIFKKDNPKLGKYTTMNTIIAQKDISKIEIEEFDYPYTDKKKVRAYNHFRFHLISLSSFPNNQVNLKM